MIDKSSLLKSQGSLYLEFIPKDGLFHKTIIAYGIFNWLVQPESCFPAQTLIRSQNLHVYKPAVINIFSCHLIQVMYSRNLFSFRGLIGDDLFPVIIGFNHIRYNHDRTLQIRRTKHLRK